MDTAQNSTRETIIVHLALSKYPVGVYNIVVKKGTSHTKHINRLKRIAGQVTGLVSMIEDKRYCIDILTQIKAVKSALASVEREIVDEHLSHCVQQAISSKKLSESDKMLQEIKELLHRARF